MKPNGDSALRAWWDLLRSELLRAWRRRGIRILAVLALGALLFVSGNNHKAVSDARSSIETYQAVLDDPDSFEDAVEEGPGGELPFFGSETTEEEYRDFLGFNLRFSQATIRKAQVVLHPEVSHALTLGFFGTVPGLLFAVLLAATFAGAEFRWGYLKTAASNEPRRSRLMAGKIVAIWIMVAMALAILLALSYPVNAIAAEVFDLNAPVPVSEHVEPMVDPYIDPSGPPSILSILREYGVALITLGFYSTVAFGAVAWSRATLAGPLASLGLLALEGGFLTRNWTFLRHVVPAQQSAFLRGEISQISDARASGIWYEPLDRLVEFGRSGADAQLLSEIPDWRALLVLSLWVLIVAALSVVALRSRDIPS